LAGECKQNDDEQHCSNQARFHEGHPFRDNRQ
jgi:hypothetical protein